MSKFKKFMSAVAVTSALSLVFTASVDAKQYIVKKGDTLYSIARKNGTTVARIMQDNKIANGVIKPGQVLNVGNAPVIQDAVNGQHKVAGGDTLYSIAKKNGLTLDELKRANNLKSNYVPVGRVLSVVKPAAVQTTVATTTKQAVTTKAPVTTVAPKVNVANGQHQVAKGDTLYSIARKNGLTLDELKKVNNLKSNYVPVGRVLNVTKPVSAPKTTVATTKKIETTKVTTTQATTKQTQVPKPVVVTTTKQAETTKKVEAKPAVTTTAKTTTKKVETTKTTTTQATTKQTQVPKPVVVTTTKQAETTKKEETKPAQTTTTKTTTAKPKTTTTTKKVANVPGATFKNQADQELWNKVANNYKNDPTVGGLKPRVAQMKQFLGSKFDVKDFSVYRPGDYDGTGHGHGDGLALDLMVPVGGKKGDDISKYLTDNYDGLGIYYLIWKQKFYMNQNNIYGPANTWNWMPDRGSITQNHYDHVHISFKK